MPPRNLDIGDILYTSFALWHTDNEQLGLSTGGYLVTAKNDVGLDIQTFASRLIVAMAGAIIAKISTAVQFNGVTVELLDAVTGRVTQSAFGDAGLAAGTRDVSVLPTQVAAVVRKKTGFAGRKFNGRLFIPFCASDWADAGGELSVTGEGDSVVMANAYFQTRTVTLAGAGSPSLTVSPVLIHRGAPPSTTAVVAQVTSHKFGSQKRRGDYGKSNSVLS